MEDRPTVILTDRSESFLMYLSILLQRMDFDVLPSADGPSLIKLTTAIQPGTIILGPDIEGLTPFEIIRTLRDMHSDMQILAIGEEGSSGQEILDAGCSSFLTKPIQIEALYVALSELRSTPYGQRRNLRTSFHSKVTLTMDDQIIKCQGITLSEGGIFIRRKTPFQQGSRLQVEIPLGEDNYLFLDGEVIYTKQLSKDQFSMPPGMAIRFLNMIDEDRESLKNFIKQLLAGDLLEEQDEPILMA